MPTPGQRLQAARKSACFSTAEDAAQMFGWNPGTYRAHESGRGLRVPSVQQYALAFRVQPEWLMFGRDEDQLITSRVEFNSVRQRLKDARVRAGFSSALDAVRQFGWIQSTYL